MYLESGYLEKDERIQSFPLLKMQQSKQRDFARKKGVIMWPKISYSNYRKEKGEINAILKLRKPRKGENFNGSVLIFENL